MKVYLLREEVEQLISERLTEKLGMGFHGWMLTTPDHVDGYLEFEEKPAPPIEKAKK